MVIEATSASRRRWLAVAAATWLAPCAASAAVAEPRDARDASDASDIRQAPRTVGTVAGAAPHHALSPCLASAWSDARGRHFVGLLTLAGTRVQVTASIEVPTRAHAVAVEADGSVLAVARRPGDWLLRWHPGGAGARATAASRSAGPAAEPRWQWAGDDRCFTGHTLHAPGGDRIYTAETDLGSGAGRLVERDARSLAALRDWPTQGCDPHDLQWLPSGRILVANGGIATLPETGRAKRALEAMDSSLVEIDPDTSEAGPALRLPDQRLSMRHLALHPSGRVAIALQAEHDEPDRRAQAPVLALYDPVTRSLSCVPPGAGSPDAGLPASVLEGYGGDVAALADGWVVSCTRAGQLAFFTLDGRWQGLQPLHGACALAQSGSQVWAAGPGSVVGLGGPSQPVSVVAGVQIDNHAAVWRPRSARAA